MTRIMRRDAGDGGGYRRSRQRLDACIHSPSPGSYTFLGPDDVRARDLPGVREDAGNAYTV